jgi:hypothetical protein
MICFFELYFHRGHTWKPVFGVSETTNLKWPSGLPFINVVYLSVSTLLKGCPLLSLLSISRPDSTFCLFSLPDHSKLKRREEIDLMYSSKHLARSLISSLLSPELANIYIPETQTSNGRNEIKLQFSS